MGRVIPYEGATNLKTKELGQVEQVFCFGGVYSNHLALQSMLEMVSLDSQALRLCLGDLGAFGPSPDRVFPLLQEHRVEVLQGNYDDSIGNQKSDCQCGYTDPRDNHFAQLSYDYTLAKTSASNRSFLQQLPQWARFQCGDFEVLACHGSPRRVNEFLWESNSSDAFLNRLLDQFDCDVLLCTHTGIKWHRALGGRRHVINVGALGRPENDGTQNVWYTSLRPEGSELQVDFVPVEYEAERLAFEMRREGLPDEFIETTLTGWWTTCLEVLPARERSKGIH